MNYYLFWTLVHLSLTVVNVFCAYYVWPHGWALACTGAAGATLTMAVLNLEAYHDSKKKE